MKQIIIKGGIWWFTTLNFWTASHSNTLPKGRFYVLGFRLIKTLKQ